MQGIEHRLYHFGGTAGVLAVYASDVCQFRDMEWEKVQVEESVKRVAN